MVKEDVFVKGNDTVFIDLNRKFVYEVCVFCRVKNYFSLANHVLYSSSVPLIVTSTFFKRPYTIIRCKLYSAPFSWLLENGFERYYPPIKKKRSVKPKININDKSEITTNQ